MVTLTEFVVRAYSSVWFRARQYLRPTDAPRHYFQWMQALKSFPTYVFKGVSTIFENGLYWCHSENWKSFLYLCSCLSVILTLLPDEELSFGSKIRISKYMLYDEVQTLWLCLHYNCQIFTLTLQNVRIKVRRLQKRFRLTDHDVSMKLDWMIK